METNVEIKNQVEGIAKEVKADVKNLETKLTADVETVQKSVDALTAKVEKAAIGAAAGAQTKGAFEAAVEAKAADLASLADRKTISIELDKKAAVDMLSAAGSNFAGKLELGYQAAPAKPTSISDIVAAGTINVPTISYVRITGYEGGPQMVAEGTKKPALSLTTESVDATVKKIAVSAKFSEEATKDVPTFVSLVQSEMVRLLEEKLDDQSLNGTGSGQELQGILPLAKAFDAGYFAGTIPNAQPIDALRVAIAQSRIALYTPSHIVLNPNDVASLELQKDKNGSYLLPTIFNGQLPSIGRVQIVEQDEMPQGKFLVGAFDRGAKLYTRDGLTIRVYDQNEDDALKNMILVVVEGRWVQLVNRPESFITGSFTTAVAALNKA